MLISSPMSRCETSSHAGATVRRRKAATTRALTLALSRKRERGSDPYSLSRSDRARFLGLDWTAALAAVVARHRFRHRIGRHGRERAVTRPGARRRLEIREERLAHLEQRARSADGRRALAQRRARVEAARIPGERLAQLVHAHLLRAVLDDQP